MWGQRQPLKDKSMDYFAIIVLFLFAVGMAVAFVAISHLFGPKRPSPVKLAPYECGVDPRSSPRRRFSIKFYIRAMLFILFDIETVFLVPWAVIYRKALENWGWGTFIFWEMIVFVFVLAVGLAYVWKKGALDWE